MPADPRPALSIPDVAARLGVGPETVAAWIRRGDLRAVNVARDPHRRPVWRVMRADLDAFLAVRAAAPAPVAPVRRRRRSDAAGAAAGKWFAE